MSTTSVAAARRKLETRTERRALPQTEKAEVVIDHAPRCRSCHRPLFAMAARPWHKRCDACHAENFSPES